MGKGRFLHGYKLTTRVRTIYRVLAWRGNTTIAGRQSWYARAGWRTASGRVRRPIPAQSLVLELVEHDQSCYSAAVQRREEPR